MADLELEQGTPALRARPGWAPRWRQLAVVIWCGFLGAVLLLLALLMGWGALQAEAASGPGFALLGGCFLIGWLIATLVAVMALSLSAPPRDALRPEST